MMTERSLVERAEILSRRRARMLPVLAIIYLSQQGTYFIGTVGNAHLVRLGAWVILSIVLLLALVTKGFWFHSKEVRELIDDENTRANRLDAIRVGFAFGMAAAIGSYLIDHFEPLAAGEVAHLVLTLGIGAALIRFAFLERRAHRDG